MRLLKVKFLFYLWFCSLICLVYKYKYIRRGIFLTNYVYVLLYLRSYISHSVLSMQLANLVISITRVLRFILYIQPVQLG